MPTRHGSSILETINRFAQTFGLSHQAAGMVITRLFSLLEEQRDYVAIRDLCEGCRSANSWPAPP